MSLVYKSLSVSCFNRQLQLWVTQHGSLGRDPLSPRPVQMLRVTGEVGEGASHWVWGGGNKMFQELRQAFSFKPQLYEKAAICGMTTWIFVGSDTLLPSGKRFYFHQRGNHRARVFFKHMGGILYEWNWNTIMHEMQETLHAHEHQEMRAFHLQSQNQPGWGLGHCFLKSNGCKCTNEISSVRKTSPRLYTAFLPPPPLSIPATDLPLNVFTFSSFNCSQTALFYFIWEVWILGFPSQAELSTALSRPEKRPARTLNPP